MTTHIRVTRKTARLLRHMLEYRRIESPVTGVTAHLVGKVGPGSFYPAVVRLEEAGWIRSWWEELPTGEVRPRRRYYSLTEDGVLPAERAVKEYDNRKPWWKRLIKALDDVTEGDD